MVLFAHAYLPMELISIKEIVPIENGCLFFGKKEKIKFSVYPNEIPFTSIVLRWSQKSLNLDN